MNDGGAADEPADLLNLVGGYCNDTLGDDEFAVHPVEDIVELTIRLGSRTNPAIRCGGVSLNTSALSEADAAALCNAESARLGLPVADPMRGGAAFERLIDRCLDE